MSRSSYKQSLTTFGKKNGTMSLHYASNLLNGLVAIMEGDSTCYVSISDDFIALDMIELKLVTNTCCEKLGMRKFGEQVTTITMFDPQLKIAALLLGLQFGGNGPPNFSVSEKKVFVTVNFGCNFYVLSLFLDFYGDVGSDDENSKAQARIVYEIDSMRVCLNHRLVAYIEYAQGDELFTVYIINNEASTTIGKLLAGVIFGLKWAGDNALLHIIMAKTIQPDKVWLLKLGANKSNDTCFLHEEDDTLNLHLEVFESKNYILVAASSKVTRLIFYLYTSRLEYGLMILSPSLYI